MSLYFTLCHYTAIKIIYLAYLPCHFATLLGTPIGALEYVFLAHVVVHDHHNPLMLS